MSSNAILVAVTPFYLIIIGDNIVTANKQFMMTMTLATAIQFEHDNKFLTPSMSPWEECNRSFLCYLRKLDL